MLRLQNNRVIYNDSEELCSIEDMIYIEDGFRVTLPDGSMVFIPEQDCTASELEVFQAYHEYYKDTGGVKPPPAIDIEVVRDAVIESMNQECERRILSGFTSEAFENGTEKHYDCEMTDQSRIYGLVSIAQLRIAGLSTEILKWKGTGELECYEWSPEQMLTLGLDLKRHIQDITDRFYSIRIYILAPERTIEELEAITWDLEL
ncbi:DUF4376 domain-containing protein [Ruminiclostridium cellobioparum]|uniref:DUF4376 domain-containing protein n=1 Tax=Ruminiclostridium cellobioparum TaxID=29355 RepID=UPI0028B16EBF|nr:hypothetical protein [Ruminiclostridium cellobioparum]